MFIRWRRLRLESLESRRALAVLADLDHDADLDAVEPGTWYENVDGDGNFAAHSYGSAVPQLIAVGDFDGNGSADIVTENGWFSNEDGQGRFSSLRAFPSSFSPDTIRLEDVGGDGDLDLIIRNATQAAYLENVDGQGTVELSPILTMDTLQDAADANRDGHLDLLTIDHQARETIIHLGQPDGSFIRDVAWRDPPFELPEDAIYTPSTYWAQFAPVDHDGWPDLLRFQGADGGISWHVQLNDGAGHMLTPLTVGSCFGCLVRSTDFDQDGDVDFAADWALSLYRNDDAISFPHIHDVQFLIHDFNGLGDFNGDGFVDAYDHAGTWTDGSTGILHEPGTRTEGWAVSTRSYQPQAGYAIGFGDLDVGDLDGDNLADLVLTNYQAIEVYEDSKLQVRFVLSGFDSADNSQLVDLDSDGDLDIVAYGFRSAHGFINQGDYQFTQFALPVIPETRYLAIGDLSGDSRPDLVSVSRGAGVFGGSQLAVSTNRGNSFNYQVLSYSGATVLDVELYDRDADGDLDINLSTGRETNDFNSIYEEVWFENRDGQFASEQVIGPARVGDVVVADFNGDGRDDVLEESVWRDLASGARYPVKYRGTIAAIEDLNGDGWADIISRQNYAIYLNLGSANGIAEGSLVAKTALLHDIKVVDLDGDHTLDLLAVTYAQVVPYLNRTAGDVTGDGVFDSSDLVAIMTAGQYEDPHYRNATYETGDWNGDGEFDSADLVFIFQAGTYQPGDSRQLL